MENDVQKTSRNTSYLNTVATPLIDHSGDALQCCQQGASTCGRFDGMSLFSLERMDGFLFVRVVTYLWEQREDDDLGPQQN
ncbi:hypothetical protein AVEN_201120-1 [Araneus ventricosus]|uniref:Uncharacterized protein n=1 Tax=Araneus ventricosus TaxID=182803 RepID=A0A4Y2GE10_ARAVE|nr:hypothetical protein AVEN_201120-1 [Araneus ventricosus]